jgi:hypothetical protein
MFAWTTVAFMSKMLVDVHVLVSPLWRLVPRAWAVAGAGLRRSSEGSQTAACWSSDGTGFALNALAPVAPSS